MARWSVVTRASLRPFWSRKRISANRCSGLVRCGSVHPSVWKPSWSGWWHILEGRDGQDGVHRWRSVSELPQRYPGRRYSLPFFGSSAAPILSLPLKGPSIWQALTHLLMGIGKVGRDVRQYAVKPHQSCLGATSYECQLSTTRPTVWAWPIVATQIDKTN